ncbi:glycosyltransferase [Nocardioides zhouii]|uniref:Glycosyltransferase n=1 Tax=Nocardioides zhouii TaxID=1168729 RepID=A0A4Q2SYC1_9ACTN|nr:glycosyltransferase [Nocardioides zhouii]RYC09574.1 glycosyltransferase [Nocardioides zhouii]
MRILCTFVGGLGHLTPLLPLARAARAAGHEVAIAGSGGLVPRIEEAGFRAYATSPAPHHSGTPAGRDLTPLPATDARAAEQEFADNFADRGARRMAGAVPGVLEDFRPDVVLRDETDLGTTIAVEPLGIPVVTHLVLASGLLVRPDLVGPRLDVVRAEHGLAPDPDLALLTSGPVLSEFPPSFRSPHAPLRMTPSHYRSTTVTRAPRQPGRPRVYVTLGTIFNKTSGDLFERLLAGVADLDAEVVVTVGRDLEPAAFGATPRHVRVERFVPQDEVLAATDLVVSHGGSGSLMAALAHGLPSVLLPLGADQPHNALRARELGVATTIDAATATAADITRGVASALADAAMAARCREVAAEIGSLPSVDSAVALLERAASRVRP